ncbi:hypothetical protein MTO96_026816 [Rhipicephalus appendiculatus]
MIFTGSCFATDRAVLTRGTILLGSSSTFSAGPLWSCRPPLRLPCLNDDPRLESFLALTRLPRWLEDARLRAWRRFLPWFERMLVADEAELERAWRWLLLRLLVLRWLLPDRVAELSGLRALRARPPRRLRDELRDRPRLTFLRALRRFGDSLAVSMMVLVEKLLERFVRLTLAALVGTALMLVGIALAGCDTSAAFRSFRATVVATDSGASGSTETALGGRPRGRLVGGSLVGGASAIVGSCSSLALRLSAAFWRILVALGLLLRHGCVTPGPVQPSAVDPLQPAVVFSVAARRQGGPQETASVRVREIPVSAASRACQLTLTEAAFGSRALRACISSSSSPGDL